MREILLLTKTLFKTSAQSFGDAKSKKFSTIALYIILGLCFLPMLIMLYQLFQYFFETMGIFNQYEAVFGLGFYLGSFITFFFAMFMVPGVFYFSKDISTLLYLPIRPKNILISKFLVMLLYDYLFSLFIVIPMFIAYVEAQSLSISFVFISLIIVLFLPIIPLLYASIIVIIMMRFLPFAKNKDRFNMIFGTFGLLFTLIIVYYFQYTSMNSIVNDQNFLIGLLTGDSLFVTVFQVLFPTVPMMANALAYSDFIQLFMSIGIIILLMIVFILLGNKVYLKSAINVSDSMSTRKKLNHKQVQKYLKKQPVLITYLKKELRLLIRNPFYFQNCVLMSFIMPIIILVPVFLESGEYGISQVLEEVNQFIVFGFETFPKETYAMTILLGIGLGFFMSNSNMISATAISREGSNFVFMKYIPVPYMTQISAKALSGIVISLIGGLLLVIPMIIFLEIPALASILLLLTFILGDVYGNYLGVFVDLIHPKLVWEQEISAVKQNLTAAIMMLSGFAFCGILGFLGYFIGMEYLLEYAVSVLILLIITMPLLYRLVSKRANYLFNKL